MRKSWFRVSLILIGASFALLGLSWLAWVSSQPRLVFVKLGTYYTNQQGEVYEFFMFTNASARRLVYSGLGFEFRSQSGWNKMEHAKVPGPGKPYENGMMYGGEIMEPRSGLVFADAHRKSTDPRPYRYAALWALPPKAAESRPRWQKWVDAQAIKWFQRPLLLPYGVVRSPTLIPEGPNPRPGADAGWRALFAFASPRPRAAQAGRSVTPTAASAPAPQRQS